MSEPTVDVTIEPPTELSVVVEPPLPDVVVVFEDHTPETTIEVSTETPEVEVSVSQTIPEVTVVVSEVGLPGPPGPAGEGRKPFEYMMPVAQTTATFEHNLGHDPTAVQVFVDGELCDEYTVVFPVPNEVVRLGFDIPVRAFIRIL